MNDQITRALEGCSDTRAVETGRGVLPRIGPLVAELGQRALVVADANTWAAAGERAAAALAEAGVEVETFILDGSPVVAASYANAERVRDRLRGTDLVPVAVGSGTINDIVKRASFEVERPYAVVGSAASMDGYTGFGAPMTIDGVKITMPCPAPAVAVLDLDVVSAAPAPMGASGFGDLIAKIPAGADWILADAVGVEPIDDHVWDLVQSGVRTALADPAGLAAGEPSAYAGLVDGLVLSGLSMQVYEGTRPASGAEHYFSHIWELAGLGHAANPPLSHGFKVGIGTLTVAAFFEQLLARDLADVDVEARVASWPSWGEIEAEVRVQFTGALADNAVRETAEKYLDTDALRARLTTLTEQWDDLRGRLQEQLMPAGEISRLLETAGAPYRPEHIGLSLAGLRETFPKAMYYRSRYTCLDVAREAGWFDELVDEVFTVGWWGRSDG